MKKHSLMRSIILVPYLLLTLLITSVVVPWCGTSALNNASLQQGLENSHTSNQNVDRAILQDLKEYVNIRFEAENNARVSAYNSMEKRLEGMNEFRRTIEDQGSRMITRAEHQETHNALNEDIRSLRESRAEINGKASQTSMLAALLIATLGVILSGLSFIIRLKEKFMKI